MPTMFSVKKYSDVLDKLCVERGVGGYFGHNLVSVDATNRKAVFKNVADGTESKEDYTLLILGKSSSSGTELLPLFSFTLPRVNKKFKCPLSNQ